MEMVACTFTDRTMSMMCDFMLKSAQKLESCTAVAWWSFILTVPRFLLNGSFVAEKADLLRHWNSNTQWDREGGKVSTHLSSPCPFSVLTTIHPWPKPSDTYTLHTLFSLNEMSFYWRGGPWATEALYSRLKSPCQGGEMPQSSIYWFSESDHQRIWGLRRGNEWQTAVTGYLVKIFFLHSLLVVSIIMLHSALSFNKREEKEHWRPPVVAFKAQLKIKKINK